MKPTGYTGARWPVAVNATGQKFTETEERLAVCHWLLARAKAIDGVRKAIGTAWFDPNGEFDFGNIHYSASYTVTVKCVNASQAGHAVLKARGGDFDVLVSQLPCATPSGRRCMTPCSEPIAWAGSVNGVPERVLKRADSRFLPHPGNRWSHQNSA
jgi:hypothetical protein